MRIKHFEIEGLIEFFPDIHKDDRGCFVETWQETRYQKLGISSHFVQDNFSFSSYGTLRGLHFQKKYPQGKLITAIAVSYTHLDVYKRQWDPLSGYAPYFEVNVEVRKVGSQK